MRSPPTDLDADEVAQAVAAGWGVCAASIGYVPEGGGSHHWKLIDDRDRAHFVTVDDLDDKAWIGDSRPVVLAGLVQALRTSEILHTGAGLEFVLAPVPTHDGDVLRRVTDRYTVSLFPYLAGHSHPFGPYADPELRLRALDMVVALHGATSSVLEVAPRHDLFTGHADLQAFVGRPDEPWGSGPFAATVHGLFTSEVAPLADLVAGFDRLFDATVASRVASVITHGEPHPANLLSVDERVLLIDWDTAALAPPERDLWLIVADDNDVARYERATGRRLNRSVLTLYELRWFLDDLASAIHVFRNPHEDNADIQRYLEGLAPRLAQVPGWIDRVNTVSA